jgi:hypothetical protein
MENREAEKVVIEVEREEEEQLRKQGWYLGRGTEDVAAAILLRGQRSNTFTVYRDQNDDNFTYILSARFHVKGVHEDIILEHLRISQTPGGLFQIQGQSEEHSDVVSVVNSYVSGRQPPLAPALGKSFETQLSVPDDPPSYSQVDRTLAPDITPLPNVTAVKIETAKEAKTGRLSPGSVRRTRGGGRTGIETPDYISNPHWHRYKDHCCLHPKNCLHFCCYRDTYWTGRREAYTHKWYSLRRTGPLRVVGLLVLFFLCGLCIGCGSCCYYLLVLCCFVCCYEES